MAGRKHLTKPLRRMRIQALYRKPNTSKKHLGHRLYPYQLRGLTLRRGAWRDNLLVERLWRSVKYEEDYLHDYESVGHAKLGIARCIDFYNSHRPHSSLVKKTPDEFYFATLR